MGEQNRKIVFTVLYLNLMLSLASKLVPVGFLRSDWLARNKVNVSSSADTQCALLCTKMDNCRMYLYHFDDKQCEVDIGDDKSMKIAQVGQPAVSLLAENKLFTDSGNELTNDSYLQIIFCVTNKCCKSDRLYGPRSAGYATSFPTSLGTNTCSDIKFDPRFETFRADVEHFGSKPVTVPNVHVKIQLEGTGKTGYVINWPQSQTTMIANETFTLNFINVNIKM